MGAYPNYNEEEEERRYYRRKRLGVLKNVLAASAGGMLTYGVYLGRWSAARPAGGGLGPGPGEEALPTGSARGPKAPPSSSGSICGSVSQGKRNLGLPSSFTSPSAPSQMQLRRSLSGGVPGWGPASALESLWAALGALGRSAAILGVGGMGALGSESLAERLSAGEGGV